MMATYDLEPRDAGTKPAGGKLEGHPAKQHNWIPVMVVSDGQQASGDSSQRSVARGGREIAEQDKTLFSSVLISVWFLLLILYGTFTKYGDDVLLSDSRVDGTYLYYHNIALMIFVGFGFLMTFLHRYAFSALGYTFLVSMLCIYWGMLCTAFFHQCYHHDCSHSKLEINLVRLIYGLFAAAAVMISFGGVLGKVTILQLLIMALIEVPIFSINEHICANLIKFQDVGGAMTIHLFGAYFGLTVCMLRRSKGGPRCPDNKASTDHDVFSMIGTLFLWVCWPSFNAALAGNLEQLTIINTVMSIGASCVTAFMVSGIINRGKFEAVAIQNATLAGGVAMGAAGDLVTAPAWAMVVGSIGGVVSTLGFSHVQPFLFRAVRLHDTCGIHNLHGMPGVVGAVVSMVAVSSGKQVERQALALLCSLAVAVAGGTVTGLVMNCCRNLEDHEAFKDDKFWVVDGVGHWARCRSVLLSGIGATATTEEVEQAAGALFREFCGENALEAGGITKESLQAALHQRGVTVSVQHAGEMIEERSREGAPLEKLAFMQLVRDMHAGVY